MQGLLWGSLSALWLGILTSISPCPLATNIAAIAFIGRRVGRARVVLLAGSLYTLGRTLTYMALGIFLAAGAQAVPQVSFFLQKYMNQLLGPILILVGMILLELIPVYFGASAAGERLQKRADSWGIWGAGLLGAIFALSFCPISAALFFGSLFAVAIKCGSRVVLPAAYGVGTALPVFAFAVLLAFGARSVAKAFQRLSQIEQWSRRLTGGAFILIGGYFCLRHIFRAF